MSDEIESTGQEVFERFAAVAGAPDDPAVGAAADGALGRLEALLRAEQE